MKKKKSGPKTISVCNGCKFLKDLIFPPDSRGETYIKYTCGKLDKNIDSSYGYDREIRTPRWCPFR